MKIKFNLDTIKPMVDWLLKSKHENVRDENALRKILKMPDYQIEFKRYSDKHLPVCGISYEEAVDFFMNFDKKDFVNQRLQYKKDSFIDFYNDLDNNLAKINMLTSISDDDYKIIEELLSKGLPNEAMNEMPELNIILIISIGNSMGWPYDHYIDYDIANLNMFESINDFLHVTAHEINHIIVGPLLGKKGIKPEDFFIQNFAYEGIAVHYNNNLQTLFKKKKYNDKTYGMCQSDMDFYEKNFDEIFEMIQRDYKTCKNLSIDEVANLVSNHYELFEFMGEKVKQYPTYYFGCYMFGLVDLNFGKEKLYESINNPQMFVKLYNSVVEKKYQFK